MAKNIGSDSTRESRMHSFNSPSHCFDLRAAVVLSHGQRVLLHRAADDRFWSLPGGRVEAGEVAADAVVREMSEELGEPVRCERLMFIVENFFEHAGMRHHEIGLYFEGSLRSDSRLLRDGGPFEGREPGRPLTFEWFDRSRLADVDVRPAPLCEALASPSNASLHLAHRDASGADAPSKIVSGTSPELETSRPVTSCASAPVVLDHIGANDRQHRCPPESQPSTTG